MFRLTFDSHDEIESRIKFRTYSWRRLTGSSGMRLRLNKTEKITIYLLNGNCKFEELTNLLKTASKKIEEKMKISMLPKYINKLNFIKCVMSAVERGTMGLW